MDFTCLILLLTICTPSLSKQYEVYWLAGSSTIERDVPSLRQSLDVFCYTGSSKNIFTLWQTVKFHIRVKNDDFKYYIAGIPEDVYQIYSEDSYEYGWSVIPFQSKNPKSFSINLYNTTCLAVNTKQKHAIELQVIRVDAWRVALMATGIILIFASRVLSGNPVFFYLCGILVGVSASIMVLVYYLSKLLPRKPMMYGVLVGGWTVCVYLIQQIWENIRSIILSYQNYVVWYSLIVSFISFMICYRIGPPKNRRSKNLVMWTLQAVGVLKIFYSTEYQEAAATIVVATLIFKYFPDSLLYQMKSAWRRRFPPKPKLLTNEEYYELGARETKQALDQLRKHCASPDCAQWRIMLKLDDSKRFASFVEGDSHLSDEEILDYEAYAFSINRSRKENDMSRSRIGMSNLEPDISEDEYSLSEDED